MQTALPIFQSHTLIIKTKDDIKIIIDVTPHNLERRICPLR